jgi:hypothetical protein
MPIYSIEIGLSENFGEIIGAFGGLTVGDSCKDVLLAVSPNTSFKEIRGVGRRNRKFRRLFMVMFNVDNVVC